MLCGFIYLNINDIREKIVCKLYYNKGLIFIIKYFYKLINKKCVNNVNKLVFIKKFKYF